MREIVRFGFIDKLEFDEENIIEKFYKIDRLLYK